MMYGIVVLVVIMAHGHENLTRHVSLKRWGNVMECDHAAYSLAQRLNALKKPAVKEVLAGCTKQPDIGI